jgi:hypothetical protein
MEEQKQNERPWTPGPWPIEYSDYGDELWFGGSGCGLYRIGERIAYLGGDGDDPEKKAVMDANAHLIAASPELYEALEAVRNSPVGGSGQLIIANSLWDQMDAALAKARGEGA